MGKGVTQFNIGDPVLGHALGMDPKSNKASESAFQDYAVIRTNLASPILSWSHAVAVGFKGKKAAFKFAISLMYPRFRS